MEQFIDLLQDFAFNLSVAALPIISAFLIAALNALIKKWLAEMEAAKPELYWYLEEAAKIAVLAAEKSNVSGFVEDKKEYALEVAQQWLDSHGWDEIDIVVLDAAIEAEVLKQFGREPNSAQ